MLERRSDGDCGRHCARLIILSYGEVQLQLQGRDAGVGVQGGLTLMLMLMTLPLSEDTLHNLVSSVVMYISRYMVFHVYLEAFKMCS